MLLSMHKSISCAFELSHKIGSKYDATCNGDYSCLRCQSSKIEEKWFTDLSSEHMCYFTSTYNFWCCYCPFVFFFGFFFLYFERKKIIKLEKNYNVYGLVTNWQELRAQNKFKWSELLNSKRFETLVSSIL